MVLYFYMIKKHVQNNDKALYHHDQEQNKIHVEST